MDHPCEDPERGIARPDSRPDQEDGRPDPIPPVDLRPDKNVPEEAKPNGECGQSDRAHLERQFQPLESFEFFPQRILLLFVVNRSNTFQFIPRICIIVNIFTPKD